MLAPQLIPLNRFYRETIAFLAAHAYLLGAELEALKDRTGKLFEVREALSKKIPQSYAGPTPYFLSRLFISYVASFEVFLQEMVTLVVAKNPKKVGATSFTLAEVIDAATVDQLVARATEETLNKLMYKKPAAYLEEICQITSIDGGSLQTKWLILVEAKARRDLGVHNAWRCNETYLRKLKEAGIQTNARHGDILTPPIKDYLERLPNDLAELASNIARKIYEVHWPEIDIEHVDLEVDA